MGKSLKSGDLHPKWPRVLKDFEGREVLLTEERWNHIVTSHPEMAGWLDWVEVALADPHIRQISEKNEMCVSYYHLLPKVGLYVMVVTDWSTEPARVLTAFPTKKPKRGKRINVRKPDAVV